MLTDSWHAHLAVCCTGDDKLVATVGQKLGLRSGGQLHDTSAPSCLHGGSTADLEHVLRVARRIAQRQGPCMHSLSAAVPPADHTMMPGKLASPTFTPAPEANSGIVAACQKQVASLIEGHRVHATQVVI